MPDEQKNPSQTTQTQQSQNGGTQTQTQQTQEPAKPEITYVATKSAGDGDLKKRG